MQRAGSCLVALGCGLGVTDDSFIVVPEGAAIFVATYGGSFPAPSLDGIPGLHVLPLTTDAYDPRAPSSFVIDSDVLIEIERFCVTPSCEGDRVERIRHLLLLNIAYRDLLPGLALAQVHQPGRRSTNVDTATCAAKAVHEVIDWDRARISTHDPPARASDQASWRTLLGPPQTPGCSPSTLGCSDFVASSIRTRGYATVLFPSKRSSAGCGPTSEAGRGRAHRARWG